MSNKHPIKTYLFFLSNIFVWTFFFGGIKFIMKNISPEFAGFPEIDEKNLLDTIVAFLSIGGFFAYIIGGGVANAFTKRSSIMFSVGVAIIALLIHISFFSNSYHSLMITMIVVGFCYGLFAVMRTIITYIEIVRTKFLDTTVNGLATITFITSIIAGSYFGNLFYEWYGIAVFWIFLCILPFIFLISIPLDYEGYEHHTSFRETFSRFFNNAAWILKYKITIIFTSAFLWAISTIVSIKAVSYSEAELDINESTASLILLFSALGAILGNASTVLVQKGRWLYFRIFTYIFAISVACFPFFTSDFLILCAYSVFVGFFMGAATNLIDAYYLVFIGENDKKESGSALFGAILNLVTGGLFLGLQLLPQKFLFPVLGGIAFIMAICVRLHIMQSNRIPEEEKMKKSIL